MSDTNIQPVFEVTVSVTMQDIIDNANDDAGGGDYDSSAYIQDDAIQKALIEKVTTRIIQMFDRHVLDGIQKLAQAEIKDQLAKKSDAMIESALAGPAQSHPEMTLEELILKSINDAFDSKLNTIDRVGSGTPQNRIAKSIADGIEKRMKSFEGEISAVIREKVKAHAELYATAMLDAKGPEESA